MRVPPGRSMSCQLCAGVFLQADSVMGVPGPAGCAPSMQRPAAEMVPAGVMV